MIPHVAILAIIVILMLISIWHITAPVYVSALIIREIGVYNDSAAISCSPVLNLTDQGLVPGCRVKLLRCRRQASLRPGSIDLRRYASCVSGTSGHRYRRSNTPAGDAAPECPSTQWKQIVVCLPANGTHSLQLPYSSFPDVHTGGTSTIDILNPPAGQFSTNEWYITTGDLVDWKWSNLVAETGYDWSSWTTGVNATKWRPWIKLHKISAGLEIIFSANESSMGCQDFVLAPWVPSGTAMTPWSLRVCKSNSRPEPIVISSIDGGRKVVNTPAISMEAPAA